MEHPNVELLMVLYWMLPKIPTYTFINFQEIFPPIRLFSPIFLLVFEEISHLYFYLDLSSIRNSRVSTYNNFIKQVCWFSGQNWKYSQCSRRRIGKEFAKSFKPEKIRISTREIHWSFHFAQGHYSWTYRNSKVRLLKATSI